MLLSRTDLIDTSEKAELFLLTDCMQRLVNNFCHIGLHPYEHMWKVKRTYVKRPTNICS